MNIEGFSSFLFSGTVFIAFLWSEFKRSIITIVPDWCLANSTTVVIRRGEKLVAPPSQQDVPPKDILPQKTAYSSQEFSNNSLTT